MLKVYLGGFQPGAPVPPGIGPGPPGDGPPGIGPGSPGGGSPGGGPPGGGPPGGPGAPGGPCTEMMACSKPSDMPSGCASACGIELSISPTANSSELRFLQIIWMSAVVILSIR